MTSPPADDDPYRKLYRQALGLLARRGFGREELTRRLAEKGGAEPELSAVVERCSELGYLNDPAYVRDYLRSRIGSAGYGPVRARIELTRRGFDPDQVAAAWEELAQELDQDGVAARVLARKFPTPLSAANRAREYRRRYDFLWNRGFERDTISRVLERPPPAAESDDGWGEEELDEE